jgi:HK97 family phage portal protein
VRSHVTWGLLRDQPNGWQTPDVFKELIQSHALGWGNGRAAIIRNGTRPIELIPMMPDRTCTEMVDGEKFHITAPDIDDPILFRGLVNELRSTGRIGSNMVVLPDRDVLHIIGLSGDGVSGYNIGRVFDWKVGTGLAGHRLTNRQMKKGFTGRVMLTDGSGAFNGPDAEKQAVEFMKQFRERYSAEKDGEVAGLLRRGMTAEVLSMSNADAQLIEQMKFSRQDVMLIFGLQHMPGDSSAAGYNSLEQKKLDQLESTNDRWMTRWELQCDMKLRTETEKLAGRIYFKFNAGSRLRTDIQTTANVLTSLVRSTIITKNEAREKLEMNPVEGGDVFENPAIQVKEEKGPQGPEPENRFAKMVAYEARKVIAIFENQGNANASKIEKAVTDFYNRQRIAIAEVMSAEEVNGYIETRLKEIGEAIVAGTDIKEICTRWIEEAKK